MDIQSTENNSINSNGYNLGWLYTGEWAQYTITDLEPGVYSIRARVASGSSGGFIRFMSGESGVSKRTFVGPTGGWDTWKNLKVENIVLTEDDKHFRFFIDKEGYNLASFEFIKEEASVSEIESEFTFAKTIGEYKIEFNANKPFKNVGDATISVFADGVELTIKSIELNPENSRGIIVEVEEVMNYLQDITISFDGKNITCFDDSDLKDFDKEIVFNEIPRVHQIPGKIEAEDFDYQFGIALEACEDAGSGFNLSYLNQGDFIEYEVFIPKAGKYNVEFRTAAEWADGRIKFELLEGDQVTFSENLSFNATNGWQNWETSSDLLDLPEGRYTLKITVLNSDFNINWFSITAPNGIKEGENQGFIIYPNPAQNNLLIRSRNDQKIERVVIFNLFGKELKNQEFGETTSQADIDISLFPKGQYIAVVYQKSGVISSRKFIKF
jgi:hypothetical protein